MTGSLCGFINTQKCEEHIHLGNGYTIVAPMRGDVKGTGVGRNKGLPITMKNVLYSESMKYNLFSLAKLNENVKVGIYKNEMKLDMPNGKKVYLMKGMASGALSHLFSFELKRNLQIAAVGVQDQSYQIMEYHQMLGHPSEAITKTTAKLNEVELKGEFGVCEHCTVGKAQQSNVKKETSTKASSKDERVSMDITEVNALSLGNSQ